MRRREFLKETGAALAAALGSCRGRADWRRLRLVHAADAGEIERTALADAASLLERAIGVAVPIVPEPVPVGELDVPTLSASSSLPSRTTRGPGTESAPSLTSRVSSRCSLTGTLGSCIRRANAFSFLTSWGLRA